MSTLEQLPIKKGRPRKAESFVPQQPENLVTLQSAIEKKKRVTRKKSEGESAVKLTTQEKKLLVQEKKQATLERVEKKKRLKKSIEVQQEQKPLEDEEAFRGENGSTIFTGPENLPIEEIPTTESVVYQPEDIDAWGINEIIGRNVEQHNEEIESDNTQEEVSDFNEVPATYSEAHIDDNEEISPEELYAPLLPKDTARDDVKLDYDEYYNKPSQSFNDKPKSVLKRFWNWISRKNPDMHDAYEYYSHDRREESAKHNKNKKQAWFKEFNQSKSNKTIDREAINKFVDSQNRNAVARSIDDYNEIEDRLKEEAEFDHALNEFKNHLNEEERLYDARVAEQAMEEKKLLEAWGPYLKARALEKNEAEITQTISDLESKRFYENGGITELSNRNPDDYHYDPEQDYEDLTYPKELADRTEYQEELAIKLDNKANDSLKTKGRAPRGSIKGFTPDRYYN